MQVPKTLVHVRGRTVTTVSKEQIERLRDWREGLNLAWKARTLSYACDSENRDRRYMIVAGKKGHIFLWF